MYTPKDLDDFAIAITQGLLASGCSVSNRDMLVTKSYDLAEAMMEESRKRSETLLQNRMEKWREHIGNRVAVENYEIDEKGER